MRPIGMGLWPHQPHVLPFPAPTSHATGMTEVAVCNPITPLINYN